MQSNQRALSQTVRSKSDDACEPWSIAPSLPPYLRAHRQFVFWTTSTAELMAVENGGRERGEWGEVVKLGSWLGI